MPGIYGHFKGPDLCLLPCMLFFCTSNTLPVFMTFILLFFFSDFGHTHSRLPFCKHLGEGFTSKNYWSLSFLQWHEGLCFDQSFHYHISVFTFWTFHWVVSGSNFQNFYCR